MLKHDFQGKGRTLVELNLHTDAGLDVMLTKRKEFITIDDLARLALEYDLTIKIVSVKNKEEVRNES